LQNLENFRGKPKFHGLALPLRVAGKYGLYYWRAWPCITDESTETDDDVIRCKYYYFSPDHWQMNQVCV